MLKKSLLEKLYTKYNHLCYVSPDPLQFCRPYKYKEQQEIVCLIAASFAYGNVKQIIKAVNNILLNLGPRPKDFLLKTTKPELKKMFKNFKYRFTTGAETADFLWAISQTVKEYGSFENLFLKFYKPNKDFVFALKNFAAHLRSYGDINTLIPNPAKNSALKRLNLFLRWCVRCDEVDLGCWKGVNCADLLIPLDVHMHRAAKALGLTKRNQADLKTALEISANLAKINPQDPIKYDFCLTRFGIRPDMSEKDLEEMAKKL